MKNRFRLDEGCCRGIRQRRSDELGPQVMAVDQLMRAIGIVVISLRTFRVRTIAVDPFLICRLFVARSVLSGPARCRIDFAYHSLTFEHGDMYLCAIKDERSKKVLRWSVADHMRLESMTEALDSDFLRTFPSEDIGATAYWCSHCYPTATDCGRSEEYLDAGRGAQQLVTDQPHPAVPG
ncbi:hypothetical protein E5720_16435 [Rhodococcus sp. PAMC28707]|uniref:hypothetical protein n=1 Tax=unclassified Rhodococcus (in: high G+C Gram-positive bacteria) TaxID=192944 RepID=UPI00109DA306|nr:MULTISPECIES: hypothetical protein [unclassified Rhodococcus (in: high G+C Gram-positive bacteria)]QCB51987.1 hypothetical protein E5769_19085 [Rhodococcus sp. PAMC28705]QCB59844.1 hypothetical protein E5720_16435 [Rhodococcus sp. PAMC28707]